MINVLALVLAGGRVDELLCLTERRAKASLPIFGIYRIIDFVLSNLMHAGIENIGILSQFRPHDLVRHIGTGEHWDFSGRTRAIQILPPYRGIKESDWYKGTADAVYQNIPYIEEYNTDHILIASADHIYRMDYRSFIQFHIEQKADVTVSFAKIKTQSTRFGYGIIEGHKLKNYYEKPVKPPSEWISMTLYLFKKKLLIDLLKTNASEQSHEFGKDIIPRIIDHKNVCAYKFNDYWAYARTIESYHETHMDLLKKKIDLNAWQIRTNLIERNIHKDRLPAYVNGTVNNSVVSDECIIQGSVHNSILSPGVKIARSAQVVDSIIFHDTSIGQNAKLKKVIIDKDCVIGDHVEIGQSGESVPSTEYGDLLCSGISVLGRRTHIASSVHIGANTIIFSDAAVHETPIRPGSTLR